VTEAPAIKPIDPQDVNVQQAAFIDLARKRGISWAAIAAQLGLPDKRAVKRYRRELGHRIRLRQMIG
jgi:hypothetical protein